MRAGVWVRACVHERAQQVLRNWPCVRPASTAGGCAAPPPNSTAPPLPYRLLRLVQHNGQLHQRLAELAALAQQGPKVQGGGADLGARRHGAGEVVPSVVRAV